MRAECAEVGQPYIDVGQLGFHEAMMAAEHQVGPDLAKRGQRLDMTSVAISAWSYPVVAP
jgi:hypothetical protein